MIRKEWKIPWELIDKIEKIHEPMKSLNIQIRHIFRKANQLAEFITTTAIDQEQEGKLQYQHFNQLPGIAKGILNMDKQ
ncbi:hypothetical protein MTR67_026998 [Solanum verrucosum]|uniref:RNase H type-1 domain-containing protein n=1 Tax=Solanum verrucosum TaxID=315347 RepID=A0AAF0R2U7_SOLVR|nr:hypothetical protein MTR67_026998 [Solanum verrucosum]